MEDTKHTRITHRVYDLDKGDFILRSTEYDGKKYPSISKAMLERFEQFQDHGRTVEKDVELNTEEQLIEAALLLIFNHSDGIHTPIVCQAPKGWDQAVWDHILAKPKKEQLIIAATFLAAEYDRQIYIENLNNN